MSLHHLPNMISIARLLLVPPILLLIGLERYTAGLVLFLVAGVSDGLDGFLARRYGWQSKLGGFLDPLADKLLVVSTFVLLGIKGLVPELLAVAVVARDVIIVTGAVSYYYLIGAFEAEPLLISKLNTLLQLVVVLAVLAPPAWWPLDSAAMVSAYKGLFTVTLITVVLSGAAYVFQWGQRAVTRR